MSAGVNGTTCTAEEFALSQSGPDNRYPNIYCLTRGDSIGLSFSVQAGTISILAVTVLFILIARNVMRHMRFSKSGSWTLLREPTDIYVLSLFMLDIIQALGKVTNIRWVNTGKVISGEYCTAQGAVSQFGETGVALTTVTITIHTFMSVFWRRGVHSRKAACAIVGLIYTFVALWVGIGIGINRDPDLPFYSPTPYWCWIGSRYSGDRIGGEYLWLWTALITSIILYIPLYFWSQGNLSVDPERWWYFRRRRYPAIYSILILPVSVIRWVGFGLEARGITDAIPGVATFVVDFTYSLSGAMNVILLLWTRPNLLLFGHVSGQRSDEESAIAIPKHISGSQSSGTVGRLPDEEGQGWDIPTVRDADPLISRSTLATARTPPS
ncbi:hypothetical protein K488DRAFT_41622 [Vararia minispora EC-137]|uniref:Uncharacterized protein n=1 Tax=Vararia minispora EC-137 TaxID=1314806 RepID=A0ACB8QWD2_9AGAM|nr:hypothetical protein K488DRAFT_41622 [Vararia minispora EC-137]